MKLLISFLALTASFSSLVHAADYDFSISANCAADGSPTEALNWISLNRGTDRDNFMAPQIAAAGIAFTLKGQDVILTLQDKTQILFGKILTVDSGCNAGWGVQATAALSKNIVLSETESIGSTCRSVRYGGAWMYDVNKEVTVSADGKKLVVLKTTSNRTFSNPSCESSPTSRL